MWIGSFRAAVDHGGGPGTKRRSVAGRLPLQRRSPSGFPAAPGPPTACSRRLRAPNDPGRGGSCLGSGAGSSQNPAVSASLAQDPPILASLGPWQLLGSGTTVCVVLMALLWLLQWRHRDAGFVDVGWAACLGTLAVLFALLGPGDAQRRVLVGVLGGAWGFRLAAHLLFTRVLGRAEDGRYQTLRAHWGERANRNFFWFFQAQAALAVLLATPFLLAAQDPSPGLRPLELAAAGLWAIALALESLADAQLHRWRREPANRGRTCRAGLWRYSRHPNYFFEWLLWVAYAMLAWQAPHGWLGVLPAAVMLLLILKVTGIPPTEANALRSRGDDYRRYQESTSAFVPWFPRAERAE